MAMVQVVSSTQTEHFENQSVVVPGMYYVNRGVQLNGDPGFTIILVTKYEPGDSCCQGVVIHTNNPYNLIGEIWDQWTAADLELFNGRLTIENCDESELDLDDMSHDDVIDHTEW